MTTALGANATYFNQGFSGCPLGRSNEHGLTNWSDQSAAVRKPAQSQERNSYNLTVPHTYYDEARDALNDQIAHFKREYGFSDAEVVTDFLFRHRTIRTVLRDAIPQLRATFGTDTIFNLEVSKDDEGSETIYAIAVWPADMQSASEALHDFFENWWLQRMNPSTSDLAFAYKLV